MYICFEAVPDQLSSSPFSATWIRTTLVLSREAANMPPKSSTMDNQHPQRSNNRQQTLNHDYSRLFGICCIFLSSLRYLYLTNVENSYQIHFFSLRYPYTTQFRQGGCQRALQKSTVDNQRPKRANNWQPMRPPTSDNQECHRGKYLLSKHI